MSFDPEGTTHPLGGNYYQGTNGRYYSSPEMAVGRQNFDPPAAGSDIYIPRKNLIPVMIFFAVVALLLYAFYWTSVGYNIVYNYFNTTNAIELKGTEALPAVVGFFRITVSIFVAALITLPFLAAKKFPAYICHAILGYSAGIWVVIIQDENMTIGPITFGHTHYFLALSMLGFAVLGWLYFTITKIDYCRARLLKHLPKEKFYHRKKYDVDTAREITAIAAMANTRVLLAAIVSLGVLAYFDPNFKEDLPIVLRTGASYLLILFLVLSHQLHRSIGMYYFVGYLGYTPPVFVYLLAIIGTICALVFAFVPYPYVGEKTPMLQIAAPLVFFAIMIFRAGFTYFRAIKTVENQR